MAFSSSYNILEKITLDTSLVQCYTPPMITQRDLHQLFDYDYKTGWLTRRDTGKRAGTESYQSNGMPAKRSIRINGERYNEANVVWLWVLGAWPVEMLDHKDLDPFNNRWTNLRLATPEQQSANQRHRGNNPYKWVQQVGNRYKARVFANGQRVHGGYFDTPEEAHSAGLEIAKRLHGKFIRAT